MKKENSLDEMMKKYSADLMKTYEKRNKDTDLKDIKVDSEKAQIGSASQDEKRETVEEQNSTSVIEEEKDENQEMRNEPGPEAKARFYALVTTGEGAYPVENAKVIVGRDDRIYSFIVTDKSGKTEKVFLPAYSKEDSLSADTARTVEYYADVFAEGFAEKKNLKVSAVGGSEMVLNVDLIPNEERME